MIDLNQFSLKSVMNHPVEEMVFSLKGLPAGQLGMLIAQPAIGKSHFALTLAIEHASGQQILGLTEKSVGHKTAYLSTEDPLFIVKERVSKKVKSLRKISQYHRNKLNDNLFLLTGLPDLVIHPFSDPQTKLDHQKFINELIEALQGFSLIIIDTLSEAIGDCNEVEHDRHIKNSLQALAARTGASILIVHHINKEEIRGNQAISMASGAGLSSIMRLTKFLISMENVEVKEGKKKHIQLWVNYLKANFLPKDESQSIELTLHESLFYNKLLLSNEQEQACDADKMKSNRQNKPLKSMKKSSSAPQVEPDNPFKEPKGKLGMIYDEPATFIEGETQRNNFRDLF